MRIPIGVIAEELSRAHGISAEVAEGDGSAAVATADEALRLLRPGGVEAAELRPRIQECLDRYREWDTSVLEAIARRERFPKVLEICAEELANPVALFDVSSALIGYAGAFERDYGGSIWAEVITRGFAPLTYYTDEERREVGAALSGSREPHVMRPARERGRRHVTVMVNVGDSPYGMLSQVELNMPFTPGQLLLLRHVRDRLELLAAGSSGRLDREDPLAHCIRLLVEGSPVEGSVIAYHMRRQGWRDAGGLVLFACPFPVSFDNDVARRSYAGRLRDAARGGVVVMLETHVVLVNRGASVSAGLSGALGKLAEEHDVAFGCSDAFADLAQARTAWEQASIASRMGRKGAVTPFGRVFGPVIRHDLLEARSLETLAHPATLRIAREDPKRAEELLGTVQTYVMCGCNVAKAAKALYLHRNTLEYRLSRIGELYGIDFTHMEEGERLRVALSCLLMREGRMAWTGGGAANARANAD